MSAMSEVFPFDRWPIAAEVDGFKERLVQCRECRTLYWAEDAPGRDLAAQAEGMTCWGWTCPRCDARNVEPLANLKRNIEEVQSDEN